MHLLPSHVQYTPTLQENDVGMGRGVKDKPFCQMIPHMWHDTHAGDCSGLTGVVLEFRLWLGEAVSKLRIRDHLRRQVGAHTDQDSAVGHVGAQQQQQRHEKA